MLVGCHPCFAIWEASFAILEAGVTDLPGAVESHFKQSMEREADLHELMGGLSLQSDSEQQQQTGGWNEFCWEFWRST